MRLKIQLIISVPSLSGEEEGPLVHRSCAVDQWCCFLVLAAFLFPCSGRGRVLNPWALPRRAGCGNGDPEVLPVPVTACWGASCRHTVHRGGTGGGVCRLWDRKHELQVGQAEFLPRRWKL